jgi:hypothetical protein
VRDRGDDGEWCIIKNLLLIQEMRRMFNALFVIGDKNGN